VTDRHVPNSKPKRSHDEAAAVWLWQVSADVVYGNQLYSLGQSVRRLVEHGLDTEYAHAPQGAGLDLRTQIEADGIHNGTRGASHEDGPDGSRGLVLSTPVRVPGTLCSCCR
jgi:hypothetical protein